VNLRNTNSLAAAPAAKRYLLRLSRNSYDRPARTLTLPPGVFSLDRKSFPALTTLKPNDRYSPLLHSSSTQKTKTQNRKPPPITSFAAPHTFSCSRLTPPDSPFLSHRGRSIAKIPQSTNKSTQKPSLRFHFSAASQIPPCSMQISATPHGALMACPEPCPERRRGSCRMDARLSPIPPLVGGIGAGAGAGRFTPVLGLSKGLTCLGHPSPSTH